MKTVEVLFFDGCPHAQLAVDRARDAVARSGAHAEVRLVRVENAESAEHHRFLGSPTVRVDGLDVEPSGRSRQHFGMQCRLYSDGAPPIAWIESALLDDTVHRG